MHISSSLMTLLLAMNMHALAGHFRDDTQDTGGQSTGRPAVSAGASDAAKAATTNGADADTSNSVTATSADRNAIEGWKSVLPTTAEAPSPPVAAAAPPAEPAPAAPTGGKVITAEADCPKDISCSGGAVLVASQSNESDPAVNRAETDLVKGLLARQVDVDSEQKELEVQKHVLDAAKAALDEKMHVLDNSLAVLAEKQAAHQETLSAETDRLVRIYEEMPPKEAAAVFNIMDIHVLVSVASKMTPRKISAVMGYMMPERVNLVSQYMAGVRSFRPAHVPGADSAADGTAASWLAGNSTAQPARETLKLSRQ
ncbi:MotE family protein [Acetobacter garciniae]|uniref:MotE family protein n=1 Tax=Acetobacter garciniae TaxID=2817435 RepID=UPI002ED9158C